MKKLVLQKQNFKNINHCLTKTSKIFHLTLIWMPRPTTNIYNINSNYSIVTPIIVVININL